MPIKLDSKSKIQNPMFRISKVILLFYILIFAFCILNFSYAAPCYGTKMPEKNKIFMGLQSNNIYKRYLEDNYGKLRSRQQFLLLSYGVFNWFSIDLKGGLGNIKQHPVGSNELDYSAGFAGGYGLRLKFYDRKNIKMVFGFQHISVHPKSVNSGDTKQRAILDDWQVSLLASYEFKMITPYLGTKWSRTDYIHRIDEDRKRKMSDMTKDIGLIVGFDVPITERIWLNLEGQMFDVEAGAFSLNYKF